MPAYAILDLDPQKERAYLCNVLGPSYPTVIKFEGTTSHIRIDGATDEELEIIAAMFNAIGERTKTERASVEYHNA